MLRFVLNYFLFSALLSLFMMLAEPCLIAHSFKYLVFFNLSPLSLFLPFISIRLQPCVLSNTTISPSIRNPDFLIHPLYLSTQFISPHLFMFECHPLQAHRCKHAHFFIYSFLLSISLSICAIMYFLFLKKMCSIPIYFQSSQLEQAKTTFFFSHFFKLL